MYGNEVTFSKNEKNDKVLLNPFLKNDVSLVFLKAIKYIIPSPNPENLAHEFP